MFQAAKLGGRAAALGGRVLRMGGAANSDSESEDGKSGWGREAVGEFGEFSGGVLVY